MAENKIETELLSQIKEVLLTFPKYWEEDVLLRNKVAEDLRSYNQELIEALLSNKLVKDTYSITLDSTNIFKIEEFISMLRYKNYWENSYTKYSNEIGLTSEGKYLNYNTDIVLDFPHKDSVLEGGMSNEDEGKKEIYYHNILAKEEIDTLLSPKILTNIIKHDKNGEHKINGFTEKDNLIIKGNNLLALHSLKEKYTNKIKLIYIDPPYNTGNDGFNYNDNYTMSTWLTFMKNRLEIAQELLSEDGLIFVHIDTSRSNGKIKGTTMEPYLHVLMDEIYGKNNYVGTLHWKKKRQPSFLSRIAAIMENILIFAKNEKNIDILSIETTTDSTKRVDNASNPISEMIINKGILYRGNEANTVIKKGKYQNRTMTTEFVDDVIIKDYRVENDFRVKANFRTTQEEITKFCKEDLLYITNRNSFRRFASEAEKNKAKSMTDLLLDWGQNQDGTEELIELFGTKVFDTPKPEKLLSNIIKSCTKEGDIVLDFFMGSATTQAVAHKMNRQYIGIEQMDYINTVSVPRLQKVIEGEQGGISKDVDWEGGGSFVYAELTSLNDEYVKNIQASKSEEELESVLSSMKESAYLNFKVDLEKVSSKNAGYNNLSLEERKEVLIQVLDMNQLYLSYSEIEDEQYKIPEDIKVFNHSFYQKEGVKDE